MTTETNHALNTALNTARVDDDKTGLHGVLVLGCWFDNISNRTWKPEEYLEKLRIEAGSTVLPWQAVFVPDGTAGMAKINGKEFRQDEMEPGISGCRAEIIYFKSPFLTAAMRDKLRAVCQPALDRIDREAAKAISYQQTLGRSLEVAKEMAAKWGETVKQLEQEIGA